MKSIGRSISNAHPRLAYVVTSPGSIRFLFGQIRYFRSCGFEVNLISSPGSELEAAREEGASVFAIPMKREISLRHDVLSLWRLWRVFRKVRPDITNVGTPKAGLLGGLAAVLAGVPHRMYTLHGLRLETAIGWRRRLLTYSERLACRCAHTVNCVSPSLRTRAVELGLVDSEKAVVLGPGTCNGIDTERFPVMTHAPQSIRDLRRSLGIPEGAPVIGFVGRFTHDKGVGDLYLAFVALRESHFHLRLLLVGDFEMGDPVAVSLRRRIEADPFVVRTGFVSDPTVHYHLMDVCILPSYREGFPGVPLEAQAAAVPVVTTNATGAVDSVLDGRTGFIVPAGDVAALGAAVDRLLNDPDMRERMGKLGRNWVLSVFRSEIVWAAIKEGYERLLSKSRSSTLKLCIKSLFDRMVAVFGLVLLSPVLLLTAVVIRLALGSPILFRQMRPGRLTRPFTLLKFRTMSEGRDTSGNLLPDGDRLTRVGRLIRSLSLDELPQLWNVLRGDISLVGPRPLLMEYLPRYSAEQARRHDVLPGITGWAQVNGRNALSWNERFELDVWYVDHWSLKLDALILLKTLVSVLKREGIANEGYATMSTFEGNLRSGDK